MNIEKLEKIANNQIECDFAEVQMYTLIHIAKSLEQINKTLTLHVLNND